MENLKGLKKNVVFYLLFMFLYQISYLDFKYGIYQFCTSFLFMILSLIFLYKSLKFFKNAELVKYFYYYAIFSIFYLVSGVVILSFEIFHTFALFLIFVLLFAYLFLYKIYSNLSKISGILHFKIWAIFYIFIPIPFLFLSIFFIFLIFIPRTILVLYLIFAWSKLFKTKLQI